MRELSAQELDDVSGGETNWNAVGATLGFIGIAVSAPVTMPVVIAASAAAAATMGVYSAVSSSGGGGGS